MTLNEVPNKYKIYTIFMSNKQEFIVDGIELENILNSQGNYIRLSDGTVFNKSFLVTCTLNKEKTKENVIANRYKIIKELKLLLD